MLFTFRRTRQPQAGAESYAFLPAMFNPLYPVIGGAGRVVNPPFSPVQPSPAYYPSALGPVAGIGGVIFASQYFTPLTKSTRR